MRFAELNAVKSPSTLENTRFFTIKDIDGPLRERGVPTASRLDGRSSGGGNQAAIDYGLNNEQNALNHLNDNFLGPGFKLLHTDHVGRYTRWLVRDDKVVLGATLDGLTSRCGVEVKCAATLVGFFEQLGLNPPEDVSVDCVVNRFKMIGIVTGSLHELVTSRYGGICTGA